MSKVKMKMIVKMLTVTMLLLPMLLHAADSKSVTIYGNNPTPADVVFSSAYATFYSLTASPQAGWEFTPTFGISGYSGWYKSASYTAKCEKITGITTVWIDAATAFSVTINGEMYKPGGTGGSLIAWNVSGTNSAASFDMHLAPLEAIIAAGNSKSFSYKNPAGTALYGLWWDTSINPTYTTTNYVSTGNAYSFSSNISGPYTVKAARNGRRAKDADATVKNVGPNTMQATIGSLVSTPAAPQYGIANASIVRVGDTPLSVRQSNIMIEATTNPSIPYADIPTGWVGMSADTIMSPFFTADSTNPKTKGKVIPNTSGKIGYVHVGVPAGNKYIKIIKFSNIVLPTPPPITDLWVLSTASKASLKYVDFYASVVPTSIEADNNYIWTIESGSDKIELKYDHVTNNATTKKHCRIQAKGLSNLSSSVGDVKVKVSWQYNSSTKAEVEFLLTVRSLHTFDVTSNAVDPNDEYKWNVTYELRDQLGTALPPSICAGLYAVESFSKDVWIGWPHLGNKTFTSTDYYLYDEFIPPLLQKAADGDGTQTISIDHVQKTQDISIPVGASSVTYSNISYTR